MIRAVLLILFLAGCASPYGQAVRQAVSERGKAEAAAVLNDIEWGLCRSSPVGAVIDRYGRSQTHWAAYLVLCSSRWSPEGLGAPLQAP